MKILFDQGTPAPLRTFLANHEVSTLHQLGWSLLANGSLLSAAEKAGFDCLITTDQNFKYQQNLAGRRIAIVVLGKANWKLISLQVVEIASAIDAIVSGAYLEIQIG